MLGERIAPCWCYSSIHFEWRRKRVQGHALVRQRVTLNTPCNVDQRIYFTPWRDTGLALEMVGGWELDQCVAMCEAPLLGRDGVTPSTSAT